MELHLLLRQNRLHFRVFFPYYDKQVLRQSFRALHLLLIGAAVIIGKQ